MLKFPILIIVFSVFPFSSVSFYFMYSEALLLDGCTFGIIKSSQCIDFYTISFLSLVILVFSFVLKKSILSKSNMATPRSYLIRY